MSHDRLAFDRATVRRVDVDGRMHVEISNISKACVSPYYGREIPNSEGLGLEPDRIYQLLRDPAELEKGAATFNNIPLLNKHIPISAADPQHQSVVGATGGNCQFVAPYLQNSLVIWDASSIAGIETGDQKELSSAYRYVADMTPGTFDGVAYDGRMTEIVGNHVALVEVGRAGADVVVGDSLPTELSAMKLNRKGVAMLAALGAVLKPRLAMDAKLPDLVPIISASKDSKRIAKDVHSKLKGKLAQDMEIDAEELGEIIAAATEGVEDEPTTAVDEEGGDLGAQLAALLAGKVSDEDLARIKAIIAGQAMDEGDDDKKDDDKVDRKAMDSALKAARAETVAQMQAIRTAEEEVRPLIGAVMAQDSAAAVYKLALDQAGIDVTGVDPSAYRAMVKMHAANKVASKPAPIAMDSNAVSDFSTRYPQASGLVRS